MFWLERFYAIDKGTNVWNKITGSVPDFFCSKKQPAGAQWGVSLHSQSRGHRHGAPPGPPLHYQAGIYQRF